MGKLYKKGSIVPKRISGLHRRFSHLATFGCDVIVSGNAVKKISDGDCIVYREFLARMNNGTYKKGSANLSNIHINGDFTEGSALMFESCSGGISITNTTCHIPESRVEEFANG